MAEGGRSPILSRDQLVRLGYAIAIYPGTGFMAATAAMDRVYRHILETGSSTNLDVPLFPIQDMHELMGFEAVWDFDKKWPD
jgi:2-methylisocitrate lyase-like PEP mutase family enzyme